MHTARSSQANDDWKDPSSVSGPSSSAGGQSSVDLSGFPGLGDIPAISATNPSSSAVPTQQSAFYTFPQHNFFVSGAPGPYNAVPYGGSHWTTTASSQQLPLSSYSTLNGATSQSSNNAQSQASSSVPPLMIDPALTTMNGIGASPPAQFSPPPFQHQQYLQPQHSSLNSSFLHAPASHFHHNPQLLRTQPLQQQQGTLSPYVLQSPPNGNVANHSPAPIPASAFYGTSQPAPPPAPSSSAPTAEQRKARFLSSLRRFLQPTSFSGAGAVSQLSDLIDEYGPQDVDPPTRLEILTKIRDNAGNHYFRAWAENEVAMDITKEWLKLACSAKGDTQLVETIMPLLHIIDRLPLSIEILKNTKIAKIIVRFVKDPPAPAIKDMAFNIERKIRQIIAVNKTPQPDPKEDPVAKKRKAEPPGPKVVPPMKKVAVSSTSAPSSKSSLVKKEGKSVGKDVKDAKSDSSFFSAPKPKPKLPAFKKAVPTPVKTEHDPNIAQPSSENPFEEALRSMKPRKESPATSTPPPASVASTSYVPVPSGLTRSGKKRKSVTWAPDNQLEMVKLIERAVYDDDPADVSSLSSKFSYVFTLTIKSPLAGLGTQGMHTSHNIRDLDRDEGAALHAHLFEEQIDWTEPLLIEIPGDIDVTQKGKDSLEKETQEKREQTALTAMYMSTAQIPESPAEPATQILESQVDVEVRTMLTGPESEALFGEGGPALQPDPMVTASVAELVGQLSASSSEMSGNPSLAIGTTGSGAYTGSPVPRWT
ncbi:hypothetical protein NLI96_g12832 [Meripilus lineatus]|uniref:TFIIS N-terminal domain-containing protein n=1 Tax=Meripilus lineatus TaxID=2056292 RepID=A0AAD5Y7U9_9APHY|nr:hypothetical protein NLI96_g12832 [Physisporinus lineatus]